MQQFQRLTCPALILGALLFAAGAGASEKSDDKKAEERKAEPERPSADKPAKKTTGPIRTSFDFKDMPMTKAVFEIQRLSGLNIVLHPDLARTNPTISLRVKNMPLGSALNWICTLADARYVLVDRAIYIVPKSKTTRKR